MTTYTVTVTCLSSCFFLWIFIVLISHSHSLLFSTSPLPTRSEPSKKSRWVQCSVLYCIVLCCIVLRYCIVLHSIILYCIDCIVLYCVIVLYLEFCIVSNIRVLILNKDVDSSNVSVICAASYCCYMYYMCVFCCYILWYGKQDIDCSNVSVICDASYLLLYVLYGCVGICTS